MNKLSTGIDLRFKKIRIRFKNIMRTWGKTQLHSPRGQRACSEVGSLSFCSPLQKGPRKSKVTNSWHRARFCGVGCSPAHERGRCRALGIATPCSALFLSLCWGCGSVHPHSRLDFPLPAWLFPLQRAKHRKSVSKPKQKCIQKTSPFYRCMLCTPQSKVYFVVITKMTVKLLRNTTLLLQKSLFCLYSNSFTCVSLSESFVLW